MAHPVQSLRIGGIYLVVLLNNEDILKKLMKKFSYINIY